MLIQAAFSLLGLVSLAVSSPVTTSKAKGAAPPALYYLQTEVVGTGPDCGSDKNNLWLFSYHTGAGLGDACLSANKSDAMQAYLNKTEQLFTYPGDTIGGWPMAIEFGEYQAFDVVTISIAGENQADTGFYFNGTGLQYNGTNEGWIACDWWHDVPQLFNVNGYPGYTIPSTCSRVNLLPVAV